MSRRTAKYTQAEIRRATKVAKAQGMAVRVGPDKIEILPMPTAAEGQKLENGGRIYFIRAKESGKIKIGFTRSFVRRFNIIMTDCPEPVELLGTISGSMQDEFALHEKFAADRHVGEWFRGEAHLLAHIEGLLK